MTPRYRVLLWLAGAILATGLLACLPDETVPDTTDADLVPDTTERIPDTPDVTNPDPIPDVIDSAFIECEGDIGQQVLDSLNNPATQRVLIGVGRCTSSVDWVLPKSGIHILGMGMGATQVSFTGGGSACAVESDDRDMSGGYIGNLTFILPVGEDRDILCIHGLSNTAQIERVETIGGRHHIRLDAATSDDSAAWVGDITLWTSVDAGGNALRVDREGPGGRPHLRLGVFWPTLIRPQGPAIRIDGVSNLASAVQIVGAEIIDPQGSEAVLITDASNLPILFLGGRAELRSGQSFLVTDDKGAGGVLAAAIIDFDTGADCDLLLDRPGTSNDIPCSETMKTVLPDGNQGHMVSDLSAADQAIWRKWQQQIRISTEERPPFWAFGDPDRAAYVPCEGDIGPAVAGALGAGKDVLIGRGQCQSSVNWELAGPGQAIIGISQSVPEDGGDRGSYVIFDDSEATGCAISGSGTDFYMSRIKFRSNAERDLICLEGFTGRIEQIHTRSGDGHIVLLPDENNVAADGGVIKQWLTFFHKDGCNVRVDGADSKTVLTLTGTDIGRGGPGAPYCFNGMDPATSSVVIVGGRDSASDNSSASAHPKEVVKVTGSGDTPIAYLGASPGSMQNVEALVRADSDIKVTIVAVSNRSDPRRDFVCDLLIDKPGTADNVPCSFYVPTHLDLVDS